MFSGKKTRAETFLFKSEILLLQIDCIKCDWWTYNAKPRYFSSFVIVHYEIRFNFQTTKYYFVIWSEDFVLFIVLLYQPMLWKFNVKQITRFTRPPHSAIVITIIFIVVVVIRMGKIQSPRLEMWENRTHTHKPNQTKSFRIKFIELLELLNGGSLVSFT